MDGADADVPHLGFGVYGAASTVDGNTTLLRPTFDPTRAPAFGESYCVAYTIASPPMIANFQQTCMKPRYDTGKAHQTFLI
jgi:hypothetical protein